MNKEYENKLARDNIELRTQIVELEKQVEELKLRNIELRQEPNNMFDLEETEKDKERY